MKFDFRKILEIILFWAHTVFILGAVALGFFVSPLAALALVALHRLHIVLFGECLISRMQRKIRVLGENEDFLQQAFERFFRKKITPHQSRLIDFSLAGSLVVIACIK